MLAAVSFLFEVEKLALSHDLFYMLALSSVNILCSVSSNDGNCQAPKELFQLTCVYGDLTGFAFYA